MTGRLVALLRGINVGGNKQVDMRRLRAALSNRSYTDVQTYLQSGNVVLMAAESPADVASGIEDTIAREFGIDCRVIVRTAPQLAAVMAADPLLPILGNPTRHFVAFLDGPPDPDGVERLTGNDYGANHLRVVDDHVYLWCPDGVSTSPFARLNLHRILGAAVTMRNWNTVSKLAQLVGAEVRTGHRRGQ
jgi:uncharacterized protein (DUF1697 family)